MQPPQQQGQCARHPERVAQTVCPRCGNFTCSECNPDGRSLCPSCVALGGPELSLGEPTPWERRGELGLVQGFFQTWKASLLEPQRFFLTVRADGPALDALIYAWLITIATALLQIPFTWLNSGQFIESMQKLGEANEGFKSVAEFFSNLAGSGILFAIGTAVFAIVLFPVGLVISAGLTFLGGLMFGASDKGFNATVRAICYSYGASLFSFIPFIGGLAGIWTVVLEVWAIKDVQRTSWPRAIGAVLWWLVLFCCCAGVVGAIAVGALVSKIK